MKKVLIANRGEIALRIVRACKELGIASVAVYSEADRAALHVELADEAVCIGPALAKESYLSFSAILAACEVTGADAVHPGYGFLAENAEFAQICESSGLEFIGPSSKTISLLGDKVAAKKLAEKAGVPIIPGSSGVVASETEAKEEAARLSYPVFLKAVAGGGGRGIRVIASEEELERCYLAAKREAESSFGNGDLYLEKKIENPRHIEIQILADRLGNTFHYGERDCTIQRRRQKLIEESPSPIVDAVLREEMGNAAVALVKGAGYISAGTIEFLLDPSGSYYFMEANTRIQVEHPVTEELMGVDLVKEQLRIAAGEVISSASRNEKHVFEFRINAEDPANEFCPSPGVVTKYVAPGGAGVRIDSGCYEGAVISPYYDAMIAKLIVWGKNREEAIAVGKRALQEFRIEGVKTTIPFHLEMLEDPVFLLGNGYDITTIDTRSCV